MYSLPRWTHSNYSLITLRFTLYTRYIPPWEGGQRDSGQIFENPSHLCAANYYFLTNCCWRTFLGIFSRFLAVVVIGFVVVGVLYSTCI